MAIRKFVAPTTREAMIQVRRELGDDAVIIANRRIGNRIEILAGAPDAVEALVERSETRAAAPIRERAPVQERVAGRAEAKPKVEAFQDFVRRQMEADGETPVQPQRGVREMPRDPAVRAAALPAQRNARSNGNGAGLSPNAGVAMYHDVADIEEELPAEPVAPRAAALPHSHRAQQVETSAPVADPAVFRRRPAHVTPAARPQAPATAPAAAARTAPPIDILLEAQPAAPAAPAQPRVEAVVEAPAAKVAAAPVAAGHAVVPALPIRSQAAPIATAARLREASRTAAAERAAAVQLRIPAPAVEPAPIAQVEQPIAVAPVAPMTQIEPPPVQGDAVWSWEAQFVATRPTPAPVVNAPVAQAPAAQAPVAQAPIAQAPVSQDPVSHAPVSQAPVEQAPVAQIPGAPVAGAPASVAQTPVAQAPVAQTSVVQTPAVPAPVVAAPVAPVLQAPVVEPAPVQMPAVQPAAVPATASVPQAAAPVAAEPRMESQLLAELHSMRDMLRQQIATLAGKPAPEAIAPTAPAMRIMTRLLTAGFSVDVARRIAAHVPQSADAEKAEGWLHDVLARNIRCAEPNEGIVERAAQAGTPGQVFALVGPTGVGKTTTVAKLAARFAVRHGTSALALVTLDAYRVAAPEQLRTYGRILGTPVHLAQDAATLRELLSTLVHKRLVLIDTCGVSQRDERLGEMLDLLANAGTPGRPIQRVLLMNSASHAETLEETARAWRAAECAGTILTKLDEATRIGGSLDVSLRHRLTLLGLTNGQRVPEDWHAASSKLLAHLALKPGAELFDLADEEGAALLQAQAQRTNTAANPAHG